MREGALIFGSYFRPSVINLCHKGLLYRNIQYIVKYNRDDNTGYTAIVYSLNPPRISQHNVGIVDSVMEGWNLIFTDHDRNLLFESDGSRDQMFRAISYT